MRAAGTVVTTECGDACPAAPGRRHPDRSVADPDSSPAAVVRRIRDGTDTRTTDLLAGPPGTRTTAPPAAHLVKEERMPSAPLASVLFVCVHNAGRSQMAAGFLQHLAGDRVEVRSAGSLPGDRVNPAAVEAMGEVGIDISEARPKVLTTEAVQASDYVITMGCGDACPVFPGRTYLDWALEDPAGKGVGAVRPIRDEIRTRVEALVAEIDAKQGA
ncbi:Protein-tyrosine-phosphatase OS=Streptomyces griseomycini OX=66895 GN=FHS37_007167 PE=4 SV=1 [Streptomyces griseomycini]|uniref:Protein-tyrosine-phosphatase n=2 Tax=Streptomyces griseomycini TaxID=66895 RepID=A0A7W7PXH3_9ACTN|nr:protein-tyrosine-phosphatase [Streptomyces griseomycini]